MNSDLPVENLLSKLSLEQKLSQLFIVGYWGETIDHKLYDWIESYLGGVILFSDNISSRDQVKETISEIQRRAALKLFVSVDQEGGYVERVKGVTQVPTAMALATCDNPENISIANEILAKDLYDLGFNLNFAPVLDVNTNLDNPIIGIRSFGDDKNKVAESGLRVIEAFRNSNIIPAAKHFPGHGSVNLDSHKALPSVDETLDQFIDHLYPFEVAINNDVEMMMICHIVFKQLTGDDNLPASLSSEVITNLLINNMRFKGVVVTDDLNMKAISKQYSMEDAAMLAINAGVDCLLYRDYKDALSVYNYLHAQFKLGRVSENRIDYSLRKILTLKYKYSILGQKCSVPKSLVIESKNADRLSQKLYDSAITVYKKSEYDLNSKKIILAVDRKSMVHYKSESDLQLSSLLDGIEEFDISVNPTKAEIKSVLDTINSYEEVIFVCYNAVFNSGQSELLEKVLEHKNTYVLVAGSPYDIRFLGDAKMICLTYGYTNGSMVSFSKVLRNQLEGNNRLPVCIPL